jgi:hypothetical protein
MIPRTILLDNLALVISLLAVFLGLERRSRNSSDVSSPGSSVARYRAIRLDEIGTQTPASYWVGGVDGLALGSGEVELVSAYCGGWDGRWEIIYLCVDDGCGGSDGDGSGGGGGGSSDGSSDGGCGRGGDDEDG